MNKLTLLRALITKKVPVYVHYGITHRCNLRCRMCGVWKTGDKSTELSTEQIDRLAEVLANLGTQVISIGGGEPLIREDLPKVVKSFIDRGISVRVLTNGVVVSRGRLQQVIDAGVSDFSVSLDTLDREVQDDIINQEGAFDRVMETIDFLSPIIREKKGLGLINTVVSSANLDKLDRLVDFADEKGFYVSFIPLEIHQFSGKVLGCTETMTGMNFKEEDKSKMKTVFEKLERMKKEGRPIFNSSAFLRNAGKYLSEGDYSWRCLAGSLYFSISPEGLFSICHRFLGYTREGVKVSVLDDDLPRILSSDEYRDSVEDIQKNCRDCFRPCWAEISYTFTDPGAMLEMAKMKF